MSQLYTIPNVLTPTKSKNKKIFGKYTTAIYNNLNKLYAMDNSFYIFAPRPLLPYYWNVLIPNLYWYRGFFPGIHNQGVYTTCKAQSICKRVANMTYSGGFRFEGENPQYVDYLNDFILKDRTAWKLKRALPMNNALGMTLVHLDVDSEGVKRIRFTNANRYYVETDQDGKITAFRRLVMVATPDVELGNDVNASTTGYFLIQDRWLCNGHCYEQKKLYKAPAIANTVNVLSQPIEVKTITSSMVDKLNSVNISVNDINVVYQMPFDEIGASVILCNTSSSGWEDYPYISDPLLNECHTYLREYDEEYTDKNLDRILAAKGVIIPKYMSPNDVAGGTVSDVFNYMAFKDSADELNSHIYEKTNSFNHEKDEPFFYQSDLRGQTYDADLENIEKKIAGQIFIAPSDLAISQTSDVGANNKTAYEVATVTGISKVTIDTKREFITEAMESIFRLILRLEFNDPEAKCSMVFNSDKAANPTQELEDITKQLEAGLMDKETAIKKLNPNLSDEEVQEMILKINSDQQQQMQQEYQTYGQFNQFPNEDGDMVNDNENPNEQFINENPIAK